MVIGQQLRQRLFELATLEGRTLQGQALYLLEVMTVLVKRNPRFRLKPELQEPADPRLCFKVDCSEWLEEQLFHLGGSYGLRKQELIRTFLWMGMDYLEAFGKDQLVGKEELISLIEESTRPKTMQ